MGKKRVTHTSSVGVRGVRRSTVGLRANRRYLHRPKKKKRERRRGLRDRLTEKKHAHTGFVQKERGEEKLRTSTNRKTSGYHDIKRENKRGNVCGRKRQPPRMRIKSVSSGVVDTLYEELFRELRTYEVSY